MKRFLRISLNHAVLLGGLLSACSGPGDRYLYEPDPDAACLRPGPTELVSSPMVIVFEAPATARSGQVVTFRLKARNAGNEPFSFETVLPNESFSFVVRSVTGALIWDRLTEYNGGVYADVGYVRELAPGEEVAYEATWDQRIIRDGPVPPGPYQVFATLNTKLVSEPGNCFRSAPQTLTITP